jgi:hypothetical protein
MQPAAVVQVGPVARRAPAQARREQRQAVQRVALPAEPVQEHRGKPGSQSVNSAGSLVGVLLYRHIRNVHNLHYVKLGVELELELDQQDG